MRRQYQAFANGLRGGYENRLVRKALAMGHIERTVCTNRTELCRITAREFYRAIGKPESRNRRVRTAQSIRARLMSLDFVLAHRSHRFLATSKEKLEYFRDELGLALDLFPVKPYRRRGSDASARRYFVGHDPIYLPRPATGSRSLPHFCFIDPGLLSTQASSNAIGVCSSLSAACTSSTSPPSTDRSKEGAPPSTVSPIVLLAASSQLLLATFSC